MKRRAGVSLIERLRKPVSLVGAVFLLAILVSYRSKWEDLSPLAPAFFFLVGCVLAAVGAMGRMWCSLYISGYKIHRLVSEGPYSISRNPLYFFTLLGALGVGFTTATLTIPAAIALGFALYYPGVMRAEEVKLRRKHKEHFEAYARKTPAFFPKVSLLTEPQEYATHPIIFRKHLFSAVWFIWLIGILELLKALQRTGIIPYRLPLY